MEHDQGYGRQKKRSKTEPLKISRQTSCSRSFLTSRLQSNNSAGPGALQWCPKWRRHCDFLPPRARAPVHPSDADPFGLPFWRYPQFQHGLFTFSCGVVPAASDAFNDPEGPGELWEQITQRTLRLGKEKTDLKDDGWNDRRKNQFVICRMKIHHYQVDNLSRTGLLRGPL